MKQEINQHTSKILLQILFKQLIQFKIFILFIFLIISSTTVLKLNSSEIQQEINYTDSISLSKRYYINLQYGLSFNSSDFTKIPNTNNCCNKFTGGLGNNLGLNLGFEYPLNTKYGLGIRGGYNLNQNDFKETEDILLLFAGEEKLGKFNYLLNSTLNFISLEPYFYYTPIKNLNVNLSLGVKYNFNTTYEQFEQIDENTNAIFRDTRTKIRNYFNNNESNEMGFANSLIPIIGLGLSYDLPMNKSNTLKIIPEFNFRYNFASIIKDSIWNQYSLNLGVSVKYFDFKKYRKPPPVPTEPMEPPMITELPLPVPPSNLTVTSDIKDIDSLGNEINSRGVKVEDFIYTSLKPLLNYVFFDYNSSNLPERYKLLSKQEISDFKLENLISLDIINTYYNVLNVVGYRLNQKPNAKITLIGCNSNLNDEKNNKELSKARAEKVKSYFIENWGIDESRITIEARNLPKEESKSEEIYGQYENMRVEIVSDDEEIYEPLMSIDTVRSVYNKTIRFTSNIKSDFSINNIKVSVVQDNKELFSTTKIINDTITYFTYDWTIDKSIILENTNPIYYHIIVEDDLGQVVKSKRQYIPIEQISIDIKRLEKIKDVVYENYSLILFDYGKSDLGKEHKKVVDFVKSRISKNAKVEVVGYTDAMGENAINEKISTLRAKTTHKRLDLPNATFYGKGEKELLFDNTLPEGRFYCRTVIINVENTIDD